MTEIDDTIVKVESLYRSLTGHEAPEITKPHAPIPAESDPIQHVQEQMDRLTLLLSTPSVPSSSINAQPQAWVPAVNLWETQEELLVHVDLPGIKRQNLELNTQGNVLIISGRRTPPEQNGSKLSLLRAETPTGLFRRAIPLPGTVRTEQATATLVDGVLTVRIPREAQQQQQPRAVPIS